MCDSGISQVIPPVAVMFASLSYGNMNKHVALSHSPTVSDKSIPFIVALYLSKAQIAWENKKYNEKPVTAAKNIMFMIKAAV